jgi:membrane protein
MKKPHRQALSLVIQTVRAWSADYASSMGAALAFYSLFSIAPLLLIAMVVAGHFFGPNAARSEISSQLVALIGNTGAQAVDGLVASANDPKRRVFATGLGIVALLIGATSVFNELQDSLNRIWRTPRSTQKSGFFSIVRIRLLSFGMIVGTSFLLIVSLVVSATLARLGKWWGPVFGEREVLAEVANVIFTFLVFTVMFALINKFLPRRKILWKDVWVGAAITSMLFSVGKQVIGIYLGRSLTVSAFGAVGSLAVFLLWVYYSAQIFLLGAELTHIYSCIRSGTRSGHATEPSSAVASAVPARPSRS